jgi:SAM-dependent methyltransferase
VRYSEAVAAAPPGSGFFCIDDLARLSPATLALILSPGPAVPPIEEIALALGDRPDLVGVFPLMGEGERLRRLATTPAAPEHRRAAADRVVRGLFWFLLYELEPERWDRLAALEAVSPEAVGYLPLDRALVVEVAAGSGRLTVELATRTRRLVAIEPVPGLRALLRRRCATYVQVQVVAGIGQRLPIASAAADLVISCATFGPDAPTGGEAVLAEMERCVRPGGTVAFVGPEGPGWFAARGYHVRSFPPVAPTQPFPPDLESFFGPAATAPHELVWKQL